MFRVEIDDGEVLEAATVASERFQRMPSAMGQIGRTAATESRQGHLYQNRTGETQRNTQSHTETSGDTVTTVVEIDVPHASYLMQGGTRHRTTSLTAMEDAIERAEQAMEFYIDGLGDELSRL
jgi:uncharacterized Zn ribbon protein